MAVLDEHPDGPLTHLWGVREISLALLHPLKGRSLQDSRADSKYSVWRIHVWGITVDDDKAVVLLLVFPEVHLSTRRG